MKRAIFALAALLIAAPAGAVTAPEGTCHDLVGSGWDHMPDVTDYVLSKSGSSKLGYGSECHIGGLVFSQCWLEPRLSVDQAINLLLTKARAGKKLPDTPACGA